MLFPLAWQLLFALPVTFMSVGVMPTSSKVPLAGPVLNAASQKWNPHKHICASNAFLYSVNLMMAAQQERNLYTGGWVAWRCLGRAAAAQGGGRCLGMLLSHHQEPLQTRSISAKRASVASSVPGFGLSLSIVAPKQMTWDLFVPPHDPVVRL